ncbi:MAG: HD domain-containing protein [Nanoarchaeota archaeon]
MNNFEFSTRDRVNKIKEALCYAYDLHKDQVRKTNNIPYFSHLLIVAGYVMENGGDEETVIAALLHDAVEDRGGMKTAGEIEEKFGKRVKDLVLECSDSFTGDSRRKMPWEERKELYLSKMKNKSSEALLITLADKVHNLQSLVDAYIIYGEEIFKEFKGGKEGVLWYYSELSKFFETTKIGFPHSSLCNRYLGLYHRYMCPECEYMFDHIWDGREDYEFKSR